jgi:hypothetical protein
MQVVLVMFRSDGERRSFSVVRNMTIIGRREDCDLRIPVGDVSRKHCRLVRTDDGIRIEDLGSSNGTYVNGTRVQESDLHAGDTVGIGPVQFIVQIDGVPDEDEMTAPSARAAAAKTDDEDSLIGHEMPQAPISPSDQLEEAPAEEFKIDDELVAPEPVADEAVPDELPPLELDELPAEEALPLEEIPAGEFGAEPLALKESPSDAHAAEETPAAEIAHEPVEITHEPIALEESPVEELSLEEIPLGEAPLEELASEPVGHEAIPLEEIPLEEFSPDKHSVEETAPAPAAVAPVAMDQPISEDLSIEELPAEDPLEDFELLDELEPESAASSPAKADEVPTVDELPPIPPVEEALEEVDLDGGEETLSRNGTEPATSHAAGESDWDFVVEEADGARTDHDFKIDLDSPHRQPHGQA